MGQACGIVNICIAARQTIDALPQEVFNRVSDFGCLPIINQTSRERGGELQFLISGLQQQRAAVRTAIALIEFAMNWLAKQFRKDHTLCYLLHAQSHFLSAASFPAKDTLQQFAKCWLGFFVNNPG